MLEAVKERNRMMVGLTVNALVRDLKREMGGKVHLSVLVAD